MTLNSYMLFISIRQSFFFIPFIFWTRKYHEKRWRRFRSLDRVGSYEGIDTSVDSISFANEYFATWGPLIFCCDDCEPHEGTAESRQLWNNLTTPCERIDSIGDAIEQLQVIRITDTTFAPSKGNARVKDFGGSFLPFWSERILPPKYKYGLIRRNTCSRFKPNLCVSLVNIVKYSYSKIYQVTSITNCY